MLRAVLLLSQPPRLRKAGCKTPQFKLSHYPEITILVNDVALPGVRDLANVL
jgi:hypothetical protein